MRVLFCGGSFDGAWREVDAAALQGRRVIEVEVAAKQPGFSNGTGEYRKEQYRLWNVAVLGWPLWVAARLTDTNEDVNVLRTILQRDVFDHLVGHRD